MGTRAERCFGDDGKSVTGIVTRQVHIKTRYHTDRGKPYNPVHKFIQSALSRI